MDQNLVQSNTDLNEYGVNGPKPGSKQTERSSGEGHLANFETIGERGKHRNRLKYLYVSSTTKKNGGERERGKPVHFFFFTVRAAAIFASPPLHDPGWQRCKYPPFRVADTPLRGVSWVLPALRSEGDHGARAPAQHFMV